METGKIIAKLRKERNMVQKELALYLNISVSTISNYENGVHFPDQTTLCKLAEFFNVSADYLLGRTEFRFDAGKWGEKMTEDYTLTDLANTVLELDERERDSVMLYALFLKDRKKERNAD